MAKSKLVFLDTETTGLGLNDRLFQVAYKYNGEVFNSFFKPPVPISIDSMVISHITNEMVEKEKTFLDSEMKTSIQTLLEENILVAHNASFDIKMLEKEGIKINQYIDTYKVSYYLDFQGEIPKHSLQYLRYYHNLNIFDVIAHDALGDVMVLEKLFDFYYSSLLREKKEESLVFKEMMDISSRALLMKKFTFGKYNGREVSEIAKEDRNYLRWLLNAKIMQRENDEEDDENWIYTLDYYTQEEK
ncbi:MAG: 3'-5' exonuclease [Candidatus Moraniibacteriota bacterium]|nr:MAG: 3'-5' exonuclease [Candidatus Moranbacteria bacterium]